ncbi:MAG: hypothetical protein ACOCX2_00840 [Armatimonadota bacterium]
MLPSTAMRARLATADEVNEEIDRDTLERLEAYAECPEMIDRRLSELDREWDIERMLEANAATLILLGMVKSKWSLKWLALPIIVAGFLLQHALQGWCPPIPLFRRLGIRTQREIDNERMILMLMRGDFDDVIGEETPDVREMFAIARQTQHESRA